MADAALLILAGLLVFAYLLDVLGHRIRLPSIVLLIATGMLGRQVLDRLDWHLVMVDAILPVIGTLGLILIVLDAALDLQLRRERLRLILQSSGAAALGFLVTLAVFATLLQLLLGFTPYVAVLSAMPFAVISSAVAIPSTVGLPEGSRDFVIYESSLSDILGVLFFYAWLAAQGSVGAFTSDLFGGGAVSLAAALIVALLLFFLINRIEGHVRFVPLLGGLVLLYATGKVLHLSPLVMVMVCGLLLNNPHLLEWNARLRSMHGKDYDRTLREFKGLVVELTFVTKSLFFLLLGYWTDVRQMADWRAWAVAAVMVIVIYLSRAVILRLLRVADPRRLQWIAPRGLITVLLFLTAAESADLAAFPFGAVMLVVLVTATTTALAHRGAPPAEPAQPPESEQAGPEQLPESAQPAAGSPGPSA